MLTITIACLHQRRYRSPSAIKKCVESHNVERSTRAAVDAIFTIFVIKCESLATQSEFETCSSNYTQP